MRDSEIIRINMQTLYIKNIDGLHIKAGSQKVIEYHGSVMKLRCPACGARFAFKDYDFERLREENKLPPLCSICKSPIKDDVVHFNEPIPSDVIEQSLEEVSKCDLMLLCGTSAVVYPFAGLPRILRQREIEIKEKYKKAGIEY